MALLQGLTDPQQALTYRLLALLGQERADLPGLCDADLADAAQAMAQTADTASRGIAYQHPTQTAHARRLVEEMTGVVEAAAQQGAPTPDHQIADIFRRIERGAREGRELLGEEGGDAACVGMLRRLFSAMRQDGEGLSGADDAREGESASGLIVPRVD